MTESGRPITPEQLIALNDEIATLVMAGVPLELGLRAIGGDVPSVLGRISHDIAKRLQLGQSLPESLEGAVPGLPRIYLAALEAGLKSGELPRILELLSRFMQQGLELRQRIEFAFLYPLIVLILAYCLLVTCAIESAEHWTEIWGEAALRKNSWLAAYWYACQNWAQWVWIMPTLIGAAIIGWFGFARRSLLPDRRPSVLLRLIPGMYGVVKAWHWSIFCKTAALLIEHQVAFPTALRLAGATTGHPAIDAEMKRLAENLERGQSVSDSLRDRTVIPPFLTWTLSTSKQPVTLLSALREGAGIYLERARRRCEAIKIWLPLFLIVVVGGGAVFLYAVTCLIPIIGLISELGVEGNLSQ